MGVILDVLWCIRELDGLKNELALRPHTKTNASGLGTGGQGHTKMQPMLAEFAFDLLQRGIAEIP